MPEIEVGALFFQRYLLESSLGQGGFGVVYRAYDNLLDRKVAIKFLTESSLGSQGRAKLLHEAKSAAGLNHPHIIQIYDAGQLEGVSYIIMELLDGTSLFEHRPASLDETLSITLQICQALEHAHANGVIHRDLKPENVILTTSGVAKLTDFGLAHSVGSRLSVEGLLIGTVFYISPEQALGKPVDRRADLYSLGVMLYEMSAGRLPFTADDPLAVISQHLYAPVVPPSTYNPEISAALDNLVLRLLSKLPEDRPSSATEVIQALELIRLPVELPMLELSPINRLVRGRLIGRDRELAESRLLWQEAVTGTAEQNVLLITGESGVGKTPFVREVTALAEVTGGRVLRGECYAEGGTPYTPISQIIREALGLSDKAEAGGMVYNLPELVMSSLITLVPDLYMCCPDVLPNPPLDPMSEQQRLFESFFALCTELAAHTPLMLVIEDLQWADSGSLSLLRHLARRSRSARLKLLIILTYREIELDRTHPLNGVLLDLNRERLAARLKLARFNRDQTSYLLSIMFQEELAPEFVDAIYQETEGNLFYIEEVCKALIEEGKLYRSDCCWHLPADITDIQIPQNVRLAVESRLARLPASTQDVLRLAAMIGREFDYEVLLRACVLADDQLIEALETAEQAQLIEERKRGRTDRFYFTHGLTMVALRTNVSGLRQRRMHSRIAAAIAEVYPQEYVSLAYHHREAGEDEQARQNYRKAGESAAAVFANQDAIKFYSEALALCQDEDLERFDLLVARARVYDLIANRDEQRADIEALLAIAESYHDPARTCDALIQLADLYLVTEHLRAVEPASRAVEIARQLGDPVREGRALRCLGNDAKNHYNYPASRSALETAVERFRQAGLPDEAANCLHLLSLVLGELGQHDAALEAAQEALRLSRQGGARVQESISLRRIAIILQMMRQFKEALPYAEQALTLHRTLGDRFEEVHGLNVLGIIYHWLHRNEESYESLCQSLELARGIGAIQAMGFAIENLKWTYYQRTGRYEAYLEFLEAELSYARLTQNEFLSNSILEQQTEILLLMGQYERALELLHSLVPYVENTFGTQGKMKMLLYNARIHCYLGEFSTARQELEQSLEMALMEDRVNEQSFLLAELAANAYFEGGEENLRWGLEQANKSLETLRNTKWFYERSKPLLVAAALHTKLGEGEAALKYSSEAIKLTEEWSVIPEEFFIIHSNALLAAGHREEAVAYLQRAYDLMMRVADNTQEASLRRSFLERNPFSRMIVQSYQSHFKKL